jgi:hypothetical protein
MRFFTVPDFQHLVLAFFLGLAAVLVVYLSFRYGASDKPHNDVGPIDPAPESHDGGDNPVPPILAFVYIAVLLFISFYTVLFLIKGKAF